MKFIVLLVALFAYAPTSHAVDLLCPQCSKPYPKPPRPTPPKPQPPQSPASLTVSDGPSYDFGTMATGGTADKTLTVTNTGARSATGIGGSGLYAPFWFKGGSFPGSGGTCSTTLNGGASCTLVVTYAPTMTGTEVSTVYINYFNGLAYTNSSRDLIGNASAPALVTISEGPVANFGTIQVGYAIDGVLTITNSGGVIATSLFGDGLSGDFEFKGGTYPGTGGTCASTIVQGTSCQVVVTFAPSSRQTSSTTMMLNYNDGVSAQSASRAMTGVGR